MGELKFAKKSIADTEDVRVVQENSSSSVLCCVRGTIWTLSLVTVIGAFAFLNYLQYDQMMKLKMRLEFMENNAVLLKNPVSEDTQVKRQSYPVSMVTGIIQGFIREEINKSKMFCRCSPGPPGKNGDPGPMGPKGKQGLKGEKGDSVSRETGCEIAPLRRQLPVGQTCCTALAKPSYIGNSTEIVTSYIGQEVTLPCNATGYPPPSVTFSPSFDPTGRNRFAPSVNGLTIHNVQTSDSGTYICTVENIFGKQQKIIQLRVTDPVVATTSPTTVTVNEGDTIRIRCDVSGNPTPVVAWQHTRMDGVTVPVIAVGQTVITGNTITIGNAQASNAGSYICVAQNQFEKDQASTTVNVIGKPQIIQPPRTETVLQGSTVTLHCSVVSNPPATVTWTYPLTGNKRPLNAYVNPDNSVTLSNVDQYNDGSYKCTATNSYGTVYAQSNLVVEKKVSATVMPHLQPMTGSEPILNFQCVSDGIPKPTTTWSKVGAAPLAGNSKYLALSGGNLIINGPSLATDTGTYQCFAENRNGNASDSVIVYRALGQIKCTDTFADVGCAIGQTCGAHCPDNCSFQGQSVYGYKTYSSDSAVCMAGTHSGVIPNPNDDPVVWKHVASGIFSGVTSNGITSQSHASSDGNQILSPSSGGNHGNALIG